MTPVFFRDAAAFRAWLRANHKTANEIVLQLAKRHALDRGGMTYSQALDEALCYGWIDGVRRRHDAYSYAQRFSPRRKGSVWSRVNIGHVHRLIKAKRMTRAGLAEFEKRSRVVSYDRQALPLRPEDKARFRRDAKAWAWFSAAPPSYRRLCLLWLGDAKRDETHERRLATLIECSAKGVPISPVLAPTSRTRRREM